MPNIQAEGIEAICQFLAWHCCDRSALGNKDFVFTDSSAHTTVFTVISR